MNRDELYAGADGVPIHLRDWVLDLEYDRCGQVVMMYADKDSDGNLVAKVNYKHGRGVDSSFLTSPRHLVVHKPTVEDVLKECCRKYRYWYRELWGEPTFIIEEYAAKLQLKEEG